MRFSPSAPTPERSLSPSDAELSSPEVAVCYAVNEDGEDSGEEISENGEEVDDLSTPPFVFSRFVFI